MTPGLLPANACHRTASAQADACRGASPAASTGRHPVKPPLGVTRSPFPACPPFYHGVASLASGDGSSQSDGWVTKSPHPRRHRVTKSPGQKPTPTKGPQPPSRRMPSRQHPTIVTFYASGSFALTFAFVIRLIFRNFSITFSLFYSSNTSTAGKSLIAFSTYHELVPPLSLFPGSPYIPGWN